MQFRNSLRMGVSMDVGMNVGKDNGTVDVGMNIGLDNAESDSDVGGVCSG